MAILFILLHLFIFASCIKDKQNYNSNSVLFNLTQNRLHRHLSFDPDQSEVTGNGTVDFNSQEVVMVYVTSKDSSGNLITTGGLNLELEIDLYNTSSEIYMTPIRTYMEDNLDGTYQYEYMALEQGFARVSVIYTIPGVYVQFYDQTGLSGPVVDTQYYPNIDKYYGRDVNVTPSKADYFSLKFTGYLTPPQDDNYTIYCDHDNGVRFYFNGILKIDNFGDVVSEENFTVEMFRDQYYPIRIDYNEEWGEAFIHVYWSFTSQGKQIIPSSFYFQRDYVGNFNNIPIGGFVIPEASLIVNTNITDFTITEDNETVVTEPVIEIEPF